MMPTLGSSSRKRFLTVELSAAPPLTIINIELRS